jgi:hypothetical protein
MKLETLNTKKFLHDPQSPDFLKGLEKHKEFQFISPNISKTKICTYIVLMYDPASELRRDIQFYPERKSVAAETAGFKKGGNGYYSKGVEAIFVGKDKEVNAAIAKYLWLTYDIRFSRYAVLEVVYFKLSAQALMDYDKDIDLLSGRVKNEIIQLENEMLGGDEVADMRKALYAQGEQTLVKLRPEDIVKKIEEDGGLEEFSVYGDYKVDGLKFEGDELPEE